jgi:hypothetical protein
MFAILTLLAALSAPCDLDQSLPVIFECVDELAVVHIGDIDEHCVPLIVFIRDGMVLDTRMLTDEMLFVAAGDSVQMHWQDWFTAHRVVIAKTVGIYHFHEDPRLSQDGLEWWAAARVMRQLRVAP